jgi:hypothetical protein
MLFAYSDTKRETMERIGTGSRSAGAYGRK